MRKIEEREGRREIKEGREKENKNTVSKEGIKFKRQKINHQFKGKHKKNSPIIYFELQLAYVDG